MYDPYTRSAPGAFSANDRLLAGMSEEDDDGGGLTPTCVKPSLVTVSAALPMPHFACGARNQARIINN